MAINPTTQLPARMPQKMTPVTATTARGQSRDVAAKTDGQVDKKADKKDGFSFWDLIDIINPLQHIPIVSSIYREITGDKINGFARIAGGAVFGGFIGAAIGGANAIAAQETGSDLGELALHKIGIGSDKKVETQVADTKRKDVPVIEVRPLPGHVAQAEALRFVASMIDLRAGITWDDEKAKLAAASAPVNKSETIADAVAPNPAANVDKAQIQTLMMQALQKYQELQTEEKDKKNLQAVAEQG